MSSTEERYVGAEKGSRSDGDGAGVDNTRVKVEEDAAADFDVTTVVYSDGRDYPGVGVKNGIFLFFCCSRRRELFTSVCDSTGNQPPVRSDTKRSTYSFHSSAICLRVKSPALLRRFTAREHRWRSAVSCGVKA